MNDSTNQTLFPITPSNPPPFVPLDDQPSEYIEEATRVAGLLNKHRSYYFTPGSYDCIGAVALHCAGLGRIYLGEGGFRLEDRRRRAVGR